MTTLVRMQVSPHLLTSNKTTNSSLYKRNINRRNFLLSGLKTTPLLRTLSMYLTKVQQQILDTKVSLRSRSQQVWYLKMRSRITMQHNSKWLSI